MGDARELAAGFALERAADGARGATGLTAAALAGFAVLVGLATQVPPVRAVSPFASDPAARWPRRRPWRSRWPSARRPARCIELTAVLAGLSAFGRYLGIRR